MKGYCETCGRPSWSFVHAPTHPANRGNESITHPFLVRREVLG